MEVRILGCGTPVEWFMPLDLQPHEWVREVREDKGIRQVDVEKRSAEIDPRLKISQSHLSKIEKGRSPLAGLGAEKLDVLRQILDVEPQQWVRSTGLDLVMASDIEDGEGHKGKEDFPPGLVEAAEQYKSIDPLMAHPKVLLALSKAGFFGGGPRSPQEWIQYFVSVRQWIKVD